VREQRADLFQRIALAIEDASRLMVAATFITNASSPSASL
jgi:hypothetical protein